VSVESTIQARAIGTNTVIIKVVGLSGSVDNPQGSHVDQRIQLGVDEGCTVREDKRDRIIEHNSDISGELANQ